MKSRTLQIETLDKREMLTTVSLIHGSDRDVAIENHRLIQQAITDCDANSCLIEIPKGNYEVAPGILLRSNVSIEMDQGTILNVNGRPPGYLGIQHLEDGTAASEKRRTYGMFDLLHVPIWGADKSEPYKEPEWAFRHPISNVSITGGTIAGTSFSPDAPATGGSCIENGAIAFNHRPERCEVGINVQGQVVDVVISDITLTQLSMDGMLFQASGGHEKQNYPASIDIIDVRAEDNLRIGLAISAGEDYRVEGGEYSGSSLAGINVENESPRPIRELAIADVLSHNNRPADDCDDPGICQGIGILIQQGRDGSGIEALQLNRVSVESNQHQGIRISNSSDFEIQSSIVGGNGTSDYKPGISVGDSFDFRIEGNIVSRNSGNGIEIYDSSGWATTSNSISNNKGAGITIGGGVDAVPTRVCDDPMDCHIHSNAIIDNEFRAINVNWGAIAIEKNLLVTHANQNVVGIQSQSSHAVIRGNSVQGGVVGIMTASAKAEVVHNHISGFRDFGVSISSESVIAEVTGNIVESFQVSLDAVGIHHPKITSVHNLRDNVVSVSGDSVDGKACKPSEMHSFLEENNTIFGDKAFGLVQSTELCVDGDINGDGEVGFGDFLILAKWFGRPNQTADLDASGLVDFADFLQLAANFGQVAR